MNDGWESPDEGAASAPVTRPRRYDSGGNQNWRTKSNESQNFQSFTKTDDTWGDLATEYTSAPIESSTFTRGRGRGRGRGGDRGTNRPRQHFDGSPTLVEIPSSMVGKLIGRGGSTIAEMEEVTGARIVVSKETTAEGKTIVKVFGEQGSINEAKEQIELLTFEKAPFRVNPADIDRDVFRPQVVINWKELSAECDRLTKESWAKCPKMIKNFYQEAEVVKCMSEEGCTQFRLEHNNILVARVFAEERYENDMLWTHPKNLKPIPRPVTNFEQAFWPWPELLEEIRKAGFDEPSPIQCQAWPALLSGEDVIGIAQTGTGKTLAFLLPALVHIEHQPIPRSERFGPNVLILAPTRELALQIEREVAKYSYKNIKSVCLYGGGNRREQVNIVTRGVEIIIATPGRLNDLVSAGHVNIKSITYLVLDEADRMLDMGFEPQIRKVLLDIRPDRQTVMTSATWPSAVRRLVHTYMIDPLQIVVGGLDLAAVKSVEQRICMINFEEEEEEKFAYLTAWINQMTKTDKVIIFCGRKSRADYISSELVNLGVECQALHGDREQEDREQAVKDISSGVVQVLVATDVASRGLDIADITHVFNYDFPRHIEEYVHRVGRTGRAGKTGIAISLISKMDWALAADLVKILEEAGQVIPPALREMGVRHSAWLLKKENERWGGRGRGRFRVQPPLP